ncbi:MAG: hypothetical protein JWO31_2904 [Phycisphaerales bacterium]|nr:hypothetical protein [Phycisphaerales bacterium]
MDSPNHDPFAAAERHIEQVFQEETTLARAKRDRGLQHVQSLRSEFGVSSVPGAEPGPAKPIDPPPSVVIQPVTTTHFNGVSLKVAMIEAIGALDGPITRKRILDYIGERYPDVRKAAVDGTIASTFSRLKPNYLEAVENETNVFRRKSGPAAEATADDVAE